MKGLITGSSIGICSGLARIAGMVTPYVQHLKSIWHPLPYIILAVPSIVAGIMVKFIPETRDVGLPETLQQSNAIYEPKKSHERLNIAS